MMKDLVTHEPQKIAVGLSGGVDSSVAAALLKEAGHRVIGIHMLRWEADLPGCTGKKDRQDALKVAKHLGIPFKVVDFRDLYKEKVVDKFLKEFQAGRTPNPDIWCNEYIKFGVFMDYALEELGVDKIATGHYARIRESNYRLLQGVDETKDQSYFLYRLSRQQLRSTVFPLGNLPKSKVRELAKQFGLPTAKKPDSVGICFIGEIDLTEFLKEHIDVEKGEVVDTKGNVIGHHDGAQLYTIGQRHGFELTEYQGRPLYVIEKDLEHNQLVVGRDTESDVQAFMVTELRFSDPEPSSLEVKSESLGVRIRHLGEVIPCTVRFEKDMKRMRMDTAHPVRGVASGQHAVLYENEWVVGGGQIARAIS